MLTRRLILLAGIATAFPVFSQAKTNEFVFGSTAKALNGVRVATALYSADAGYGFEGSVPPMSANSTAGAPFYFSVDVPEGNYKITVTLGGDKASETTVKAELRRLMLERVAVPRKGSVTKTFIANVRTPLLPDGTFVRLKVPRETTTEARAWDARLTLEFVGNPAVRAIKVEPVMVPTIYVLGDSTVCDQSGEPYASWGQMLTRFFKPTVAIANHGESGESVYSSLRAGRFDKIISLIKPGDYFIVQFGHNDQKSKDPEALAKYRSTLVDWANQVKAKGAIPVIVTPMNRHRFENGVVPNNLGEFPEAARDAAKDSGAILIDLNTGSKILYEALGAKPSLALFMHTPTYSSVDRTHHSPYGAYELAKLVVQGLRDAKAPIAREVVGDLPMYNPAEPMPESDFLVPPSQSFTTDRPLGD